MLLSCVSQSIEVDRAQVQTQLFHLCCRAQAQSQPKPDLFSNLFVPKKGRNPKYEALAQPDPKKIRPDPPLAFALSSPLSLQSGLMTGLVSSIQFSHDKNVTRLTTARCQIFEFPTWWPDGFVKKSPEFSPIHFCKN
jgi:hypothetical protein